MPIYEYKHFKKACLRGEILEVAQSVHDRPLTHCTECGGPVRRFISRANITALKTNSELRDLGFTKLVRRNDGIYENLTARDAESKVMLRDKPETYPNLKKTIRD